MSIGKQIHAFLEVSEAFLRQTGVGVMNDGWSPLQAAGVAHDTAILRVGASIARNAPGRTGNGGNGNQGSGAVTEHRQDGA